ncbi:MAG: endonuclease, partial [Cyanobacteria bacterium J06606_4]
MLIDSFCAAGRPRLGMAAVMSALGLLVAAPAGLADTPLRIMAANTTSGNRQSYDPGEGTRIFQGLAPDIVLIQEFNIGDNSEGAVADWVETTFG